MTSSSFGGGVIFLHKNMIAAMRTTQYYSFEPDQAFFAVVFFCVAVTLARLPFAHILHLLSFR